MVTSGSGSAQVMRRLILGLVWSAISAVIVSAPASVAAPQRPLVFVPGILGSNLAHEGKIVWGGGDSLLNLSKLHLTPPGRQPLELAPAGIVETVPLVFGLIKIDQYSGLIEFLEGMGYNRNTTLFLFDYDWRQSNFATSEHLRRFVQQNIPRGHPYDLLVHSMGGLVARIFLTEGGQEAQDVHTLIEMGVPHYGSVNMVATLREGWGSLENLMAGGLFDGMQKIRDVLVSFPSIYELFPRYPRCCALGTTASRSNVEIGTPWSADLWTNELRWVIDVPHRWTDIRPSVDSGFHNASRMQEVMDATEKDMPQVKRYFAFEGRKVETRETVYFNKVDQTISYRLSENGDGTVHRQSGMSAHAKPSYIGLRQHATMFNDRAVQFELAEILSSDTLEIEPVDDSRDQIAGREVKSYDLSINPSVPIQGGTADISLRIEAMRGNWRDEAFAVNAVVTSAVDPSLSSVVELAPTAADAEIAAGIVRFRGTSSNLLSAGPYRVALMVDGIKRLDDFIVVLPAPPGSFQTLPDKERDIQ